MGADQDEPEPFVVQGAEPRGLRSIRYTCASLCLCVRLLLPPETVDGLAGGGGRQPAPWVRRDAARGPPLDGGLERLGGSILGDIENLNRRVTTATTRAHSSRGPGPFRLDVDHVPLERANLEPPIAGLRALGSELKRGVEVGCLDIENPARYSFDSRKGPSVTMASPRRQSTTVAALGTASPPANTQ